jgi:hypothetical protein
MKPVPGSSIQHVGLVDTNGIESTRVPICFIVSGDLLLFYFQTSHICRRLHHPVLFRCRLSAYEWTVDPGRK